MVLLHLALVASAGATPPRDAVVEDLLSRDGAPACSEVGAELDEPSRLEALVAVAEGVEHPPWVPLRAAGCVAELGAVEPEARRIALRWMGDVEAPGRALAVLQQVDAWPAEQAVRLADRAVELGRRHARFARFARPVLGASEHPVVRERTGHLEVARPAAP